jgi:protein-L-isoaspartate O-methyltransferase
VDLGSGLGRPALLAHLVTGARAIGVEVQPHLVAQARACAERLGASGVQFIAGDATAVDVPQGTVFFIYASFNGPSLERVLRRLRRGVLCAVDFEVPALRARASSTPELVFYDLPQTLRSR